MSARPVGIFDSGVGGLSVAREVRRALPAEDIVYIADTAYCPYGDRPAAEVRARALAIGRHLEAEAKLIVVACNTATGAALDELRQAVRVPAVGLEPAVKTAAARTRSGRIGVMATSGTLASERFARLVRQHASTLEVVASPCPGLVELIEEGLLHGPRLEALLERLCRPLRAAGVDAVVLGCTHYPFVREALAHVLGPAVELIDSGPAIARRTQALLDEGGLRSTAGEGSLRVFTTGDPAAVAAVVEHVWGAPLPVAHVEVAG